MSRRLTIGEIRRRYDAGEPVEQIAAAAGCSRQSVHHAVRLTGGTRRRVGAPSAGADRARQNAELVAELYVDGVSCIELQSAFQADPGTILTILREQGVPIRRGGGRNVQLLAGAVAALARADLLDHASGLLRRSRPYKEHAERVARRSYAEDRRLDRLPGPPLADAIRRHCAANGIDRSEIIGSETLSRWEAGGSVRGDAADCWLIRLDVLWWDVWPDDPAARRYFEGAEEAVAA